jgi:hypothetical protein
MTSTEALLDRLDFHWKDGLAPDLNELLKDFRDPVGRAELCAADLEWRWRSQGLSLIAAWKASDYQAFLGDAWSMPNCRQILIDAEWLARSAWGDKPHIDHFVAHHQLADTQRASLLNKLDQVVQMKLIVGCNSKSVLEFNVPSDITLGRQNPWEPSSPAWIPETGRLVVADIQQRSISRKQLGLRRVRVEEIELINLSERRTLKIDIFEISPGGTMSAFLPFVFRFQHLTISAVAASA